MIEEQHQPEEEKEIEAKDIKALVALIPPADALKRKEQKLVERRIRIRYDEALDEDKARISPELANTLGVNDKVEIVVAGRHKLVLKAVLDESLPPNVAYCNAEMLRDKGIADNSIATIRRARQAKT